MYFSDTNQTNQSLNFLFGRFLLRYTDRFLSRWTVLALDLILVVVTYLAAQFVAFNFTPHHHRDGQDGHPDLVPH